MENEKRLYREVKRTKKRIGNRERRRYLKERLRLFPEDAHLDDFDFGVNETQSMNGKYRDRTRLDHLDYPDEHDRF